MMSQNFSILSPLLSKILVAPLAVGDQLILGMQDFDFGQIFPKFAQKNLLQQIAIQCDRIPSLRHWQYSASSKKRHFFQKHLLY